MDQLLTNLLKFKRYESLNYYFYDDKLIQKTINNNKATDIKMQTTLLLMSLQRLNFYVLLSYSFGVKEGAKRFKTNAHWIKYYSLAAKKIILSNNFEKEYFDTNITTKTKKINNYLKYIRGQLRDTEDGNHVVSGALSTIFRFHDLKSVILENYEYYNTTFGLLIDCDQFLTSVKLHYLFD
ncbi:hypothetical protein [Leptospira kmetyi]|uniref:hypothetical protein n=1 Tax=Leptospira kmetyi TaxID=408139 RepID=UPI003EBE4FCC